METVYRKPLCFLAAISLSALNAVQAGSLRDEVVALEEKNMMLKTRLDELEAVVNNDLYADRLTCFFENDNCTGDVYAPENPSRVDTEIWVNTGVIGDLNLWDSWSSVAVPPGFEVDLYERGQNRDPNSFSDSESSDRMTTFYGQAEEEGGADLVCQKIKGRLNNKGRSLVIRRTK